MRFSFLSVTLLACFLDRYSLATNETQVLNDSCENAQKLSTGGFVTGSTVGSASNRSSNVIGFIQCAGDIFESDTPGLWYSYEADTARVLKFSTCSEETNFANRISVFAATEDCSKLSCVRTSTGEDVDCPYGNSTMLEIPTSAGNLYAIFIHDEYKGNSGEFGFSIDDVSAPPNGTSCDAAVELPYNTTVQGTTIGASLGESPQCDQGSEGESSSGNPGVFFYIAPMEAPSSISISMTGASVPFNLQVYEGSSCGELKCKEVEIGKQGMTTYAAWLGEMGQAFYVYVSASATGDESVTTDRFGILMIHDKLNVTEPPTSAASSWTTGVASILLVGVILPLHCQ